MIDPLEPEPAPKLTKVQEWRVERLLEVGLQEWQAVWLAMDGPYAWSKAYDLIKGGCPPYLAFDIAR